MNKPLNLKEPQFSKETQSTNEPQILKHDKFSIYTQITNKLKIMNESQNLKNAKFPRRLELQMNTNFKRTLNF
jgi:hypothetical protein